MRGQYARCCWSEFSAPCHWKDPPGSPQVTCVFFTADTAAREVPTAAPVPSAAGVEGSVGGMVAVLPQLGAGLDRGRLASRKRLALAPYLL